MIVIEARLVNGSTYIAGEDIECTLTFTNRGREAQGVRLGSEVETLAWATAQIHCQCTVNVSSSAANPIKVIEANEANTIADPTYFHPTRDDKPQTSLDGLIYVQVANESVAILQRIAQMMRRERGFTVMMTPPQILFCNVKLSPGEHITYTYKEKIPNINIPTFRGVFVKYSYKLTVGTQRPDTPISEIRLPFRVLIVEGIKDLSSYADKSAELAPSNPFQVFCRDKQSEHTIRDIALQILAQQSCRKRQNCYNISNKVGKVARILIQKTAFKIGEDLSCSFDFTESQVQCLQFTVTLQSVEELGEKLKQPGSRTTNTVSHTTHQEFCLHTQRANISLPVPLHITPTFSADIVSLKWKLHIEFVTLTSRVCDQAVPESDTCAVLWQGISDLETETIHWDLPIKVLSTTPMQCALLQQMKTEEMVVLE